jgi:pimeloyl-ACP methyl ester carboxylesterase
MQNQPYNQSSFFVPRSSLQKICLFLYAIILLASGSLIAQKKITFQASDGLTITADLYEADVSRPYILLFHQAGYSRGEYRDIAPRMMKFGYNCLAVDLRSGNEVNFIKNETAISAREKKLTDNFIDAKKDVLAAIDWAVKSNNRKVILFGSSYSASLCLMVAKSNKNVKAVIAFSPGEFFYPNISVKDEIKGLDKSIFVSSSSIEFPYVEKLLVNVHKSFITSFKPTSDQNIHGAKILWPNNEKSGEYWLAMLMFFNSIKENN